MKKKLVQILLAVGLVVSLGLAFAACGGTDGTSDVGPMDGTLITVQSGVPADTLGEEGDVCLVAETGELYRKTDGGWMQAEFSDYEMNGSAFTVRYRDGSVGNYALDEGEDECEHTFSKVYTVSEPMCVVPGMGVRYCTKCNRSFPVVISPNGAHRYQNGVCVGCGRPSDDAITVVYEYGEHAAKAPETVQYDRSETVTLGTVAATSADYQFVYWKLLGNRMKAGTEIAAEDLVQYEMNDVVTFTAIWTEAAEPDAEVLHVADDEVDVEEEAHWEEFKQTLGENLEFENLENEQVAIDPASYTFTVDYIENGTYYYGNAGEATEGLEPADLSQPVIGSTYIAHGRLKANDTSRVSYRAAAVDTAEYVFEAEVELLVKVRTVQIGVRDVNNNNGWHSSSDWSKLYTIEEALHEATAIVGSNFETTIYVSGGEASHVRTEFSRLDPAMTGYTDSSYYTVKSGVALLLPVAATDAKYAYTTGTNQTYKGAITGYNATAAQGTKDALPTEYNMAETAYSELVIPEGITLTVADGGTFTVGGVTGAAMETSSDQSRCVHLNAISANWAHLILEGTVESYGTVNVYGSVTGGGSIEAFGGKVLERFETLDWPNTKSAIGRYVGNQYITPGQVLEKSELSIDDPNEFPLENYQLMAIAASLRIHSGARYLGDVRIDAAGERFNNTGTSFVADQQFIVSEITIAGVYGGNADGEGIFLLKDGTVFTKTVNEETGRSTIEIDGDAVGGVVNLSLSVYFATFTATSKTVKLPVSANLDIVVKNGTFESPYGYEFMGATELRNFVGNKEEGTASLSGATLTLENGARVILNNAENGVIFYEGAKLTVGAGCTLEIGGKFGGEILGERGAKIAIAAGTQPASGYIGGTGNVWANRSALRIEVTFTCENQVTCGATGMLAEGVGDLAADTSYYYDGTKWVAGDTQFGITYKYYYRDAEGALHEVTATDESGNPASVTPDLGSVMLSSAGLTYAEGYKFTGWYADETFQESIYSVNGMDLSEHTVYGLFEIVNVYTFEFNTNYNTLSGGAVTGSEEGSGIAINPVPVAETNLDAFAYEGGIRAQDTLSDKQLYFLGWYFKQGDVWTKYSAEAIRGAYGTLTEDVTVTLYAVWGEKAHVTFADAATGYTYDAGYYTAGSSVSPVGYANKNDDVTVSTYFAGWTAEGDKTVYAGAYVLPSDVQDGATIAVTASRNQKVHVTFADETMAYTFSGYYMAGTIAKPVGYNDGNNDAANLTYFAEWTIGEDDSTEYVEGYPIPAWTKDGTEVALTALRKNKIHVMFKDEGVHFDAEGYYVPGAMIQLEKYADGNNDPEVASYLVGWIMNGDTENLLEFIPSEYEGETLEITAYRRPKVAVTIERDRSADDWDEPSRHIFTIEVTGVDVNGTEFAWLTQSDEHQNSTVGAVLTHYYMAGTQVTIKLSYALVDNDGPMVNNGYKDVWYEITVGGVAQDRVTLPTTQLTASSEFALEEGQDVRYKCGGTLVKTDSGGSGLVCLVEGTLVTLADGTQKKVEDLAQGDMLLAFNHFTGKYEASPLAVNIHAADPAMNCRVVYLTFSDGTKIGVITEHGFFDLDENEYVFIGEKNAQALIGHRFVKVQNVGGAFVSGEVTLTGFEVKEEFVRRYSPVSGFFNVVTEGLLSFTEVINGEDFVHGAANIFEYGEGLKYDEAEMQADIATYGIYTYEDFAEYMTEAEFEAGPWKYYKVAVGKGLVTWYDIIWNIRFFHSEWEAQGWQ